MEETTDRERDLIERLCDALDEIDKLKKQIEILKSETGILGNVLRIRDRKIRGLAQFVQSKNKTIIERDRKIAQLHMEHELKERELTKQLGRWQELAIDREIADVER